MKSNIWVRFVVAAFVLVLISLFQSANIWAGVRPNLTLTLLLSLSFFFSSWLTYAVLVLFSGLWLRFTLIPDRSLIVCLTLPLILFFINRYLPWRPVINNAFSIALGTLLFYAITDIHFFGFDVTAVFFELVYNVILGTVFFLVFGKFFRYEETTRLTI